ncbi:MAG: hypothetical protein ACYS8X_09490, partial [Planctomycetota bacterium]
MTRRERLMATLNGHSVDRPAVSFYEVGGWNVLLACDDPDEFNVYNGPSWRPLAELAEKQTDIMRMISPVWRNRPARQPAEIAASGQEIGSTRSETWREGNSRFTRTALQCADRELMRVTRRDAGTMTTWTLEHAIKSVDDLKAFLDVPEEDWTGELDVEAMEAAERELGDAGIVLVESADPICAAADMFSMGDYTVTAMTEPALFHKLLERFARAMHKQTEIVAREFPGRLWRICGSEYASEPYLPPSLYAEYVGRYTGPMVDMVQAHGGYARIHSHGNLRGILPCIEAMGPAGLDPCEPPPQGDMELADLRRQIGERT